MSKQDAMLPEHNKVVERMTSLADRLEELRRHL